MIGLKENRTLNTTETSRILGLEIKKKKNSNRTAYRAIVLHVAHLSSISWNHILMSLGVISAEPVVSPEHSQRWSPKPHSPQKNHSPHGVSSGL